MKNVHRYAIAAAAALAFSVGSAQAFHNTDKGAIAPTNNIHGGAVTYEDFELLDRVMTALATDRALQQGVTATVVVKNGKVTLNGSAASVAQAARAEKLARDAAGALNVAGTLDPSGA